MPYRKDLAQAAIDWFPRYLSHFQGRWEGVPFELLPWEQEIIGKLFGTIKEDGTRQYRTVYVEVPKKNGKSPLAAGVALKLLFADHEPGAEIYSAACDRDQASIVFNVAKAMIEQNPKLGRRCKILDSTKRIIHNTGSFYRVLSADAPNKHGFNVHGVIFDELHAQPTRDLWDVLTKGAGAARLQPVTFAITTSGFDRNSICWEVHEYARKVLEGIIDDPTFLAVIYGAGEQEDWTDEEVWKKANPSMGVTIKLDEMRSECGYAQENPASENTFRRLRLNQWVKQESRYIPMERWRGCGGALDQDDLRTKPCWAGLDLASSTDLAAFVMAFDDDDFVKLVCRFWIPEENIEARSRRDHVPYDVWVRQGFITATPGTVIDYDYIEAEIEGLGSIFDIQQIGYDPWGALQLAQHLETNGFEMVEIRQGFRTLSEPTKEMLRIVLGGKLRHGDNPVLTWMADNVVVSIDPAENVKPDKKKSTERIDGIVAAIMALSRLRLNNNGRSVYEDRGVVVG